MSATLTDISGRPIVTKEATAAIPRQIAVPPVRDVPNEQAQEFLLSGFSNLALGGATFIPLTDPTTGAVFAPKVPALYKGRISSILAYCPDMVAAAAPYLFWQLTINGQPANAWGVVPIYPRTGVASLSFDAVVDLPANAVLGLLGENTDAANTHFLAVYLYGWFWPNDTVQQ